jgi:hypothetical protein
LVNCKEAKNTFPDADHVYRWLQDESGRGLNETSLYVQQFLISISRPLHVSTGVFSACCVSQNENYCTLFTFCVIASQYRLRLSGCFLYGTTYTYMPAQRSFDIIENRIMKLSNILFPGSMNAFGRTSTCHSVNSAFYYVGRKYTKCHPRQFSRMILSLCSRYFLSFTLVSF